MKYVILGASAAGVNAAYVLRMLEKALRQPQLILKIKQWIYQMVQNRIMINC